MRARYSCGGDNLKAASYLHSRFPSEYLADSERKQKHKLNPFGGFMDDKSAGIWIPQIIVNNHDLLPIEKLILARMCGLDNDMGCYASNNYFKDTFGISAGRVSQIVSKLKDLGLISVTYQRKSGTKMIQSRRIKVVSTLKQVYSTGIGGYLAQSKGNKTLKNKTSNNSNLTYEQDFVELHTDTTWSRDL